MEEFMLPCLNKNLLGVECTGCGGQRAFLLLLEGNFSEAFFMFPAIYPIMILLIFLFINFFYRFKRDFQVKIGLIVFTAMVMAVNYGFKMFEFLQLTN